MEVIDEEAFPCAYFLCLFVSGMGDVQGCVPGYYDEYGTKPNTSLIRNKSLRD
jgi:hypothetical protein